MQEILANLEEAMQKEREPVGEHLLGHGFRPAKERRSMFTVCKSFVLLLSSWFLSSLCSVHATL